MPSELQLLGEVQASAAQRGHIVCLAAASELAQAVERSTRERAGPVDPVLDDLAPVLPAACRIVHPTLPSGVRASDAGGASLQPQRLVEGHREVDLGHPQYETGR